MSPRRIQLRRTPGWRLPPGTVHCGRWSRWSNPFRIADPAVGSAEVAVALYIDGVSFADEDEGETVRVELPGGDIECTTGLVFTTPTGRRHHVTVADARRELAGRDLACWCPIGAPCHADWLLEVANGE